MTEPHATAHDGIFFPVAFVTHDGFVAIGGALPGRACLRDRLASLITLGAAASGAALLGLGQASAASLGLGAAWARVDDDPAAFALLGATPGLVIEGTARAGVSGSTARAGSGGATARAGVSGSTAREGISGATAQAGTGGATAVAGSEKPKGCAR